jgi:dTDP-4-amino-4,6-dideoxygalactose transaminase
MNPVKDKERPRMSISTETRGVPALDLKAQYRSIRDEVDEAVARVIENQGFILGPEVASLEAEIAAYCEVPRAVGCASGTDALLLPLMAWGIEPGDEVVTSPFSFFATAGSIHRAGAKPVFVDIEPETYNIDPSLIESAMTSNTRAIVPVHLYGQTADMDPIVAIGRKYGAKILEDAAQSIGAGYKGNRAGSIGDAGALSFYPSKNLGGFGDGGMVTTRDDKLADRIARLRVHGMEPKYHHHEIGFNSRLDAIQAAVLRVKLRRLDDWTARRREAAERYRELFAEHALDEVVSLPIEKESCFHVYNQFVIETTDPADRDPLRSFLSERKIGSEIYYPIPLHLQLCFASLGHGPGDFPVAESAAKSVLALPMYPELDRELQIEVVSAIADYFDQS